MKIINVMIGLPGSGKSTFCLENTMGNAKWVSVDAIRERCLSERDSYFAKETMVFNTLIYTIIALMTEDEYEIYVDATHINAAARLKLLSCLPITEDVDIYYYFFETDERECLRRNRKRVGRSRVPEGAIKNMSERAQMFITEAEEKAYHPMEFRVNEEGEII